VAQQRVQRQCREEAQGRVDLRAAHRHYELQRADDEDRRRHPGLAAHQPAAEVVNEKGHAGRGEHRRDHQRDLQGAGEPVAQRQQPEEERRLVLVEVAADVRQQPLAREHHVARDCRETRFVRRPGIADGEARADDEQEREA
jgi:hypothetical protein